MLLAVDIGNTHTVIATYPNGAERPNAVWRYSSVRDRTDQEWRALIEPPLNADTAGQRITGAVVGSVVPGITRNLLPMLRQWLGVEPLVISAALDLGGVIQTERPSEVGSDLICNAVAAQRRYGGPAIVVDLGTATKIQAIDANGLFCGVSIAVGLGLSLEALASKAAQLFLVEMALPERIIGTTTTTAVQSGIVGGHVAMCEGLVTRVREELGGADHVILTGGYGAIIQNASPVFTAYDPTLTLDGAAMIWRSQPGNVPTWPALPLSYP